jgi:hypothetical protein
MRDSFPPHKLVTNFGRLAEELGIDEAAAFIEATLEDEEATDEAHSRFGWWFARSSSPEAA